MSPTPALSRLALPAALLVPWVTPGGALAEEAAAVTEAAETADAGFTLFGLSQFELTLAVLPALLYGGYNIYRTVSPG